MKKLFLSLVVLMVATVSYAQNTLVATLSHGDEVKVFYGAKALVDAHNAAENGDIITLSSGNFAISSITKAVTIRGAGMYDSEDKSIKATTIISGSGSSVYFNVPLNLSHQLIVEGIYFRGGAYWPNALENAIFKKCRFSKLGSGGNSSNLTFLHCISEGEYTTLSGSFTMVNSFVRLSHTSGGTFINCYIQASSGSSRQYCVFTNCVIIGSAADSSNTMDYCISNSSFGSTAATNYTQVSNLTFSSDIPNLRFPDYLGDDGTEVGIYGGALPFSSAPTYPQITKCNVSSKSTVDGKISVDIEVNTVE